MLITRTPLRISLGGGGTDLLSYYRRFGGLVVSAAINKYVYVALNRTFRDDYFLKYAALEHAPKVDDIQHPIIREILARHTIGPSLELVSVADIPSGTGLGSSGAFTVGLLKSVYAFKREYVTATALAEEACHVEIDVLGRPAGKQDQYIAAFGGLTCFEFEREGQVRTYPLNISNDALHDLQEHLLMFFTGYSRDAESVLEEQKTRSDQGDQEMLDNLHFIKEIGHSCKGALEGGDIEAYARLMDEHWQHKKKRSGTMSNKRIDRWYDIAMGSGALGGKLVGAGAGGFLLFYAKDAGLLRAAMAKEGLSEVRFTFDHDGSSVIVRD